MTSAVLHNELPVASLIDPVCGMALAREQVAQRYTFRDIEYVFDSADCLRRFLEDPDKFIDAPREQGDAVL